MRRFPYNDKSLSSPGSQIMIRIVIADDHTIMREGLKRILEGAEDIEVVGEAVDGFEALAHVRKGGFDLLMLDLSMPGRSGVDLIRQIKDEMPKLPILVLTMHEEEQYAVRAIRAGARGYLTKESAGMQLVSAIKKVASGRPYISLEVAEQLAMDAMPSNEDLPHKQLSDREFEVFGLLAGGKSITEIAELLHLSVKTVSTHKTRILHKMGISTLSDLVQYAVAHRLLAPFKM
jgi:DNA-binding NarL/FixJ family response regulator